MRFSKDELTQAQHAVVQLDLVALTEHPQTRLLARDCASLSEPEWVARRVLVLLEALDTPAYHQRYQGLLALCVQLSLSDCAALADALASIDGQAMVSRLRRAHRMLGFTLTSPSTAERTRQIANLPARRLALLERLGWEIYFDNLQLRLWTYLAKHAAQVRGWQASVLPPATDPCLSYSPQDPVIADARTRQQIGSGPLSLFVLQRERGYQRLLDAWCQMRGDATLVRGLQVEKIYYRTPDWSKALHKDAALCADGPQALPQLPKSLPADSATMNQALWQLAQAQQWAIVHWYNTMRETPLIMVTADTSIARQFEELCQQPEFARAVLSSYLDCEEFAAHACGAQFRESCDFGEVGLLAAEADGCAPWLVAQFDCQYGDWWRSTCARLPSLELRRLAHVHADKALAIYRATDLDAYRKLWSMTSEDRNITLACVSGRAEPGQVLDTIEQLGGVSGFREATWLSQRCGWGYMHMWGGGADEHHAMFHAQEAAISNRVYQYAASQVDRGWYLSGRW